MLGKWVRTLETEARRRWAEEMAVQALQFLSSVDFPNDATARHRHKWLSLSNRQSSCVRLPQLQVVVRHRIVLDVLVLEIRVSPHVRQAAQTTDRPTFACFSLLFLPQQFTSDGLSFQGYPHRSTVWRIIELASFLLHLSLEFVMIWPP